MAELSETSEKKVQQITCENDNCAHYISKRHVHFYKNLKSASNLNGNLNGSKELEHYASG